MNRSLGAGRASSVTIHRYGSREPTRRAKHGYQLQSEHKWVVEGDHQSLTEIADDLPKSNRTWAGHGTLILTLVNSVGILELPHIGTVELVTGKFDESQFDAMLRDLTESATSLPFSAGETGAGRYTVSTAPRDKVLYHAFVYLRYILSDRAPEEVRLLPALELILREPHWLWNSHYRDVPIETTTRVDAHTLIDLVTRTGTTVLSSSLSPSGTWLAERLGGPLPEVVSERQIRLTTDTPENRFVKAFVGQSRNIISRMRSAISSQREDAFRRNILRDCDRMEASLMPISRHSMWGGVREMVRIPFSSTVLQQRRGYRRVLQHFSRIRLALMIPLEENAMRDLLELKDIALLYEIWTFFRMVDEITAVLGSPPLQSDGLTSSPFGIDFAAGGTFEWGSDVRLVYNAHFSRSRKGQGHSYSVPLRPDIALLIRDGSNSGLHLFDAKFRVRALAEVGFTRSDRNHANEKTKERTGTFKRGDIYKMHAYRDALMASSVWILYPGSELRFYAVGSDSHSGHKGITSPEALPDTLQGVGAMPLAPPVRSDPSHDPFMAAKTDAQLRETLRRILVG